MDCIVLCCVVSIVFFVLFRTSIVLYGMYVCLYSHTGYICMHTHTHSTCAMQYNLYNKHEIYIIHTCICYIIWCGIAFHAAKLSCLDPLIFPYPLQWSKLHCVVVFWATVCRAIAGSGSREDSICDQCRWPCCHVSKCPLFSYNRGWSSQPNYQGGWKNLTMKYSLQHGNYGNDGNDCALVL